MLLDLTGCGGSGLAAHAGGVDRLGRDQIQVLVVGDLIEPVAVFQELDVQVLVDLLQRPEQEEEEGGGERTGISGAQRHFDRKLKLSHFEK